MGPKNTIPPEIQVGSTLFFALPKFISCLCPLPATLADLIFSLALSRFLSPSLPLADLIVSVALSLFPLSHSVPLSLYLSLLAMANAILSHPKFPALREAILSGENPREALMRLGAMDLGMAIQQFSSANPGELQELIMRAPPPAPKAAPAPPSSAEEFTAAQIQSFRPVELPHLAGC